MVAFAAFAAPALADPSVPTITATAVNDREVDVTWTWPADAVYPDYVEVYRDGADVSGPLPPLGAQSFADQPTGSGGAPRPNTQYSYTVVDFVGNAAVASSASQSARTRTELPNAPTNVVVTFAPVTNIATVTWTRGAQDSDVTYNVTAVQNGTSNSITTTQRYAASDPPQGSVTMDNFSSYTNYTFTVSAVEDKDTAIGDPGGTVSAPAYPQRSNDVTAPIFGSGSVQPSRQTLGTVYATWPAASDAGVGVDHYRACIDATNCKTVPYDGSQTSQNTVFTGVRNDNAQHTVTVVAVDGAGNASVPLTAQVLMPLPAVPAISLLPGLGDGCSPLTPLLSSSDGTVPGLQLQLFVNGQPWPGGAQVAGGTLAPFQTVTLQSQALFGADASPLSPGLQAKVGDPTPPTDAPVLRGQSDPASATETVSWGALTADGANVIGYRLQSSNLPGYTGDGQLVGTSSAPQISFSKLDRATTYDLSVAAVDQCNRPGPASAMRFNLGDTTPPSAPSSLTATRTAHTVTLSWQPSTDDVQVGYYEVWSVSAQQELTEVPASQTSFTILGLPSYNTGTYKVRAVDTAGNPGAFSPVLSVTTLDDTPPSVPSKNPVARSSHGVTTITWGPSTDNVGVVGYRVVRDGTFLANVTSGTMYVDSKAPAGSHQWSIAAYDAAGNLSPERTTTPIITTAAVKTIVASKVQVVQRGRARLLRFGKRAGVRIVLTFRLSQRLSPAQLNLRILSGSAKVRISLPAGTGRTTAGHKIAEKHMKKGRYKVKVNGMPRGLIRLVITQTKGHLVTIAGPSGGTSKPTIGPLT
jgi:hypothetical protein